jgi:polysaccharide biosynthesis protein PslG
VTLRRGLLGHQRFRVAAARSFWRLPVLIAVLLPLVVFVASDPVYSSTSRHQKVARAVATKTHAVTTTTTTAVATTKPSSGGGSGAIQAFAAHVAPPAAPPPAVAATPTTTTTTTTTSPSNSTLFGVSAPGLLGASPAQVTAAVNNMASIGLRWVRADADWAGIQPTSASSFDWSATDEIVKAAAAAGMSVELIIDDSPAWANGSGSAGTFTQPSSATAFATFAGDVAAHYGPMGVHAYEIWNEPNWHQFWLPAPNPSFYTSMLKDSYASIKAVQPGSTVISGGLAPASTNGSDYSPIDFLTAMYADGAAGSFDAVGYHAYSYPALAGTYETWSAWSQIDQTSPSIRSVMGANGDGLKQIWITEVGAPSAGPDGVGTTAQAAEITAVVQSAKSIPGLGPVFFYTYQDSAVDPDYFGLLNADGSQKPAWAALAAALG